jgi:hypothetical protein
MNRKISVQLRDMAGKSWNFEGLREFKEFCESEANFWQEQETKLKEYRNDIDLRFPFHAKFSQVTNAIDNWDEKLDSWEEDQLNNELRSLITSHLQHAKNNWLWSSHPYTERFIECNRDHGKDSAEAFLDLIINNRSSGITSGPHFNGVLLAYEFINQDSDLTKRSTSEKASLDHLRDELVEARSKLFEEVEEFKDEFNTWSSGTKKDRVEARIKNRKNNVVDRLRQRRIANEIFREARERRDELELTYKELLRLKGPAEYWNKAAKRYRTQGCMWLVTVIAALATGLFYFGNIFTVWLQGQEVDLELSTIQGIVIFGTILAVYSFLVRVLSKLTFSSFHLMRDAEEREQLTYLYLSLTKEKAVDETSRDIVLQALFSRTETGLIGHDSGPTMPAGFSDLLRKKPNP